MKKNKATEPIKKILIFDEDWRDYELKQDYVGITKKHSKEYINNRIKRWEANKNE